MLQLSIVQNIESSVLDEIGAFRYRIWIAEGARFKNADIIASQRWIDRFDTAPTTIHWLIRDKGQLVAAARLSIHMHMRDIPASGIFVNTPHPDDRPVAALNRLVVDPVYRRRGLGRFLDAQRIDLACGLGARLITVEAVGDKRCFQLASQGFTIDSVHTNDPDFSFDVPKTYYALVGKAHVFTRQSLSAASSALDIAVASNDLAPVTSPAYPHAQAVNFS